MSDSPANFDESASRPEASEPTPSELQERWITSIEEMPAPRDNESPNLDATAEQANPAR